MAVPALVGLKFLSALCLGLRMLCLSSHKEERLESAFIPGSACMQRLGVRDVSRWRNLAEKNCLQAVSNHLSDQARNPN